MDLGPVNLFVGANGTGKTNLYRALQLLKAAADGRFAHEIAREGGMLSALWSGPRRSGPPVRIALEAMLDDDATGLDHLYRIEAGLKPPAAAGFAFEPQVKAETLVLRAGRRRSTVMERQGRGVRVRGEDGRMSEWPEPLLPSETALALLGDSGRFPEIAALRRVLGNWRFFHGFRSDAGSPLRQPSLATTAPMLDEDGGNLAAVLATLAHIRGDTVELDRAVADAFEGAALAVPEPEETASFGLVMPEFPQRIFRPGELSDGQIRFLGLAAALLSYRLPPFIALNEPEASLHPAMLAPLSRLIARAAMDSQVWVVTHSAALAEAVAERCAVPPRTVLRRDGATVIEGLKASGAFVGEDGEDAP